MAIMQKIFLDHPRSVGETYYQHFFAAARYGFKLTAAGMACLIHAAIPSCHRDTASGVVINMARELVDRRKQAAAGAVERR